MHLLARGRLRRASRRVAAGVGLLLAAVTARASLDPTSLRMAEEARRQAVSGDLSGAQAKWESVLASAGPAFAVRVASPCEGLREALVARRDLAPLFVTTRPDGCHDVLWGHFASEDEARIAAGRVPQRWLEGTAEVVALAAPLAAAAPAKPAAPALVETTTPAPTPAPVASAPPPESAAPAPQSPAPQPEHPAPPAKPEPEPEEPPPSAPVPPPTAAASPASEPTAAPVAAPTPVEEAPAAPIADVESIPAAKPGAGETAADLFQKGNAAYADGRLDEAISAFEGALALDPDNPRALNNLGATWLLKGDAQRAADLAKKALDIDPKYGRAALNLGTALFAQGKPDDARPYLEKAVELDPRNVDARNNLAALLVEQRKWTEAERVLLDALEIAPDDARLKRQLTQVQDQLGVRTATPAATEAAAATPAPAVVVTPPPAGPIGAEPVPPGQAAPGGPCSKPLSAAARDRLGAQLYADGREAYGRGDMEAAEAILERALECEPENAAILNHLGAARLQAGKAGEAASAFTIALQFQPDFPEASVNLALALLAQGRCEDATSRLGGLRAQHPDSGEAAYQHARALLRCGHAAEAMTALEAAERLLPQDPRVAKLRDRMTAQQLPKP